MGPTCPQCAAGGHKDREYGYVVTYPMAFNSKPVLIDSSLVVTSERVNNKGRFRQAVTLSDGRSGWATGLGPEPDGRSVYEKAESMAFRLYASNGGSVHNAAARAHNAWAANYNGVSLYDRLCRSLENA